MPVSFLRNIFSVETNGSSAPSMIAVSRHERSSPRINSKEGINIARRTYFVKKLARAVFRKCVKCNDKYMGHNNQDLDLFQRQFLIGLYECSSRKCSSRAPNDTNHCLLRHLLTCETACCETSRI